MEQKSYMAVQNPKISWKFKVYDEKKSVTFLQYLYKFNKLLQMKKSILFKVYCTYHGLEIVCLLSLPPCIKTSM